MRVIAGKARGHRLKSPDDMNIRPTSDRVKESVFNIIQSHLVDGIVVDLFSGTGNLGIEALSRGAQKAYFIDQSKKSIDIIRFNLEKTRLNQMAEILQDDVFGGINRLSSQRVKAHIILMDPPYGKGFLEPVIRAAISGGLLHKEGILVVEHGKEENIPDEINELVKVRKKDYGNTSISFYQMREDLL
ncbi:16S rRNA (guanine(966)-N(2))-methyltransferase RsmD [Alkaliphilus crotonatoxidans]